MGKKVLVIGDRITDRNIHCTSSRLCPEAPVPVLVPGKEEELPGGAALVSENLKALGVDTTLITGSHSIKTRFFVGHNLVTRVDQDSQDVWPTIPEEVLSDLKQYDAVVISDYNKGAISEVGAYRIILGAIAANVPVFVDTKRPNAQIFHGCFAIFPNATEFKKLGNPQQFQHVIHKDGENGCYVDGQPIPTTAVKAFDVTGAGDVFLAAFVSAYLEGKSLIECGEFANRAAAISVQHVGSYVLSEVDRCQLQTSNPQQSPQLTTTT